MIIYSKIYNMLRSNLQYRILALVLAVFFWYLISGQEKVEMWVEVSVEVSQVPEEYTIMSGMVSKVTVRCRATKTMLSRMEVGRLAYNLDLSGLEHGENTIVLDPKRINLPRAVQAVEITPHRLDLEVDRLIIRELPVEIEWKGAISPYYELKDKSVEPASVRIKGPENIIQNMDAVKTRPLAVEDERPGMIQRRVGLVLGPEMETGTPDVRVELVFGPLLEEIWVRKPVEVTGAEDIKYTLEPDHVRGNLKLPRELLQQEGWRDRIHYYVEIEPGVERGMHELQVHAIVPEHGRVLEMRPEVIEVKIE
ncbi:CdaR family protein [Desulfonatronospira sp.]|uniref:CdaR family protein n=1 Tax=Desulfonatronospira sp. TaxID=1962951 RepID=UPI0025C4F497|nr:CdaR family protein [Desulfonatronospira sp.]